MKKIAGAHPEPKLLNTSDASFRNSFLTDEEGDAIRVRRQLIRSESDFADNSRSFSREDDDLAIKSPNRNSNVINVVEKFEMNEGSPLLTKSIQFKKNKAETNKEEENKQGEKLQGEQIKFLMKEGISSSAVENAQKDEKQEDIALNLMNIENQREDIFQNTAVSQSNPAQDKKLETRSEKDDGLVQHTEPKEPSKNLDGPNSQPQEKNGLTLGLEELDFELENELKAFIELQGDPKLPTYFPASSDQNCEDRLENANKTSTTNMFNLDMNSLREPLMNEIEISIPTKIETLTNEMEQNEIRDENHEERHNHENYYHGYDVFTPKSNRNGPMNFADFGGIYLNLVLKILTNSFRGF